MGPCHRSDQGGWPGAERDSLEVFRIGKARKGHYLGLVKLLDNKYKAKSEAKMLVSSPDPCRIKEHCHQTGRPSAIL